MRCESETIPERFFMLAAEAVANSLDEDDIKAESVVPNPAHIREVNLNVATAAVLGAEAMGIAGALVVQPRARIQRPRVFARAVHRGLREGPAQSSWWADASQRARAALR